MTKTQENIFDSTGLLRSDLENVKVAPERRAVFEALIVARRAEEAAALIVENKEHAVADAVKAHERAIASQPKWTPHDEWLASVGRKRMQPTSPVPLQVTEDALGLARQELREAREAVADTRAEVAKRLADYNAKVPVISREQNVREHIASENARRKAVAEGCAQPTERAKPGPSHIDRAAYYGRHGDANDRVRSRFRNGGYHRGAYTLQGGVNLDPRRGPVAKARD
jgi:hypothetical protein